MRRVRDDRVPPSVDRGTEGFVRVVPVQESEQGRRRRQTRRVAGTEIPAVSVSRIGRCETGRVCGRRATLVRAMGFPAGPGTDQSCGRGAAPHARPSRSTRGPHAGRSAGPGQGAVFPPALAADGSGGESLEGRQALPRFHSGDHRRPAHVVGRISRRRGLERFIGLSPTAPGGLPLRQRQVGKVLRRGNKHSGRLR